MAANPHMSEDFALVPVTHPGWCDPGFCEADCVEGGDVWHRSAPVLVRTRDALLTLSWVRVDERDPDARGDTEVLVEVTQQGQVTRLSLSPGEAHQLAGLLLAEFWCERDESTAARGVPGRVA